MKVLLIDPLGPLNLTSTFINLGLGYLAAMLIYKGHEVKVLDFNNLHREEDNSRIRHAFGRREPDIIGISLNTSTLQSGMALLARAKAIYTKSVFVVGGPHISIFKDALIEKFNFIDLAITGEGEYALLEICEWLEGKKRLEDIPGIIYKTNDGIKQTVFRSFNQELDKLPFPEFSCFDSVENWGQMSVYPIITSRGCPYSCSFCAAYLNAGKDWRHRSPDNVIAELKLAKEKYNISEVHFYDDNFSFDIQHAKQICKLLIEEKLDLRWWLRNGVRADKIDRDIATLIKQAGCYAVDIGIESGDPFVFSQINKGETLGQIEDAIKILRVAGIERVGGFFIVGLPYSTLNSDIKSIKLRHKLNLDDATWSFFIPYPGVKAKESMTKHGRISDNFELYSQFRRPSCETEEYPEHERVAAMMMANYTLPYPGLPFFLRIFKMEFPLLRYGRSLYFFIEYNIIFLRGYLPSFSKIFISLENLIKKVSAFNEVIYTSLKRIVYSLK